MPPMNQGIDTLIRQITAQQALEMTPQLWAKLKSRPQGEMLPQRDFIDLLRHSARRILVKIEEAGFNAETWKSYTDFFMQALVSYGTADMHSYLLIVERLLNAVLGFPSGAQPPLKEYLSCAVAQSTQRNAEIAIHIAKHPSGELPVLERQPDLEYEDSFVACIEAKPVSEAMRVLEALPSQLTFAHRHAIMHLKLCNPLPIPGCAYVSTGYSCDTCHLRGIRVGFQAMLYDEEDEEAQRGGNTANSTRGGGINSSHAGPSSSPVGTSMSVRSDAQISKKKTYGFDICMACAVTFYAEQREKLLAVLRPPHVAYEFGHASGVVISQARYHSRRHAVCSSSSSPGYPLSREASGGRANARQGSLLPACYAGLTRTTSQRHHQRQPSQQHQPPPQPQQQQTQQPQLPATRSFSPMQEYEPDYVIIHVTSEDSDDSASSDDDNDRFAATQRPPARPPLQRVDSSRGAPNPPATRCTTYDVSYISITATIAPYGARPIAWVLSREEKFSRIHTMEKLLKARLGPESDWRTRVKVKSANALLRKRATAAAKDAGRRFSTHTSPSPGKAVDELEPSTTSTTSIGPSPYRAPQGHPMNVISPLLSSEEATDPTVVEEETCAICLCPYEGEEPVIETKCHHWFHVSCIEEYTRIAEDVCPLCRAANVLPDMSRATALKSNVFHIELELTEEECQQPFVDVCVGAIITRDGNYRNATSIAAAQCIRVYPNQLRGFQKESPVHTRGSKTKLRAH